MKRSLLFILILAALSTAPAFGAPLTNAEAPKLLEQILPQAAKIFYIWHGGIEFSPNSYLDPDSIQGQYGLVGKSFPYKSVKAINEASRKVYSKKAFDRYLTGAVPMFKEADGHILAAAGMYDGQLTVRWLPKTAKIAQQSNDKLIVECQYEKEIGGPRQKGYLDFANENGKWKLDSPIDIPRKAPGAKDRDVWYGGEYEETTDYLFHVLPTLGDAQRPDIFGAYACLGFWDTTDYSTPTPFIKNFVNTRLTRAPEYFLEGTKIFVVIPRYKDTKITVELIDHPGKKPLYAGAAGKTLVFAGNTPRNTTNLLPLYQITLTRKGKSVTFIPDIDFKTERPMVKPDKRLIDLTPPESVG